MAAGRMQLGDQGDVGARVVRLDGGAHTGATGAYDEHVVRALRHSKTVHNRLADGLLVYILTSVSML
jgi:hypothetical protein